MGPTTTCSTLVHNPAGGREGYPRLLEEIDLGDPEGDGGGDLEISPLPGQNRGDKG